ncbi:hypothetical protein Y032_0362g3491 [Ancylostoma ceylanicum]|uniref:Uncharacterized protein n=1 Tax=Ancylostoma ceylanicum TaxID=53326 RepID=A0A016RW06_9BILA|nr:hypothetical protein Y032_0362g3491 [Ancylostoma ceylanicum]
MSAKIAIKGPIYGTVRLVHDNARPLTIRVARQKLLDFGWEVQSPPPYKPDLVPRDRQLILTLSNDLQGKACGDEDDLDCCLSNLSESMLVQF